MINYNCIIKRNLQKHIKRLSETYPVITVLGPRQAGKTTVIRAVFQDYPYISLENLDERARIKADPRQFLDSYPDGVIIDEVQNMPELLSYIQGVVDNKKQAGQFILTGSQQLNLMEAVTQSLAGRTAVMTLLPLSLSEYQESQDIDSIMFKGGFPRIHDEGLNPTEAMQFYVSTYIERDVRQLKNIKNLDQFTTFLKLCAAFSGQILNFSKLGDACGINYQTAREWLQVLEASYMVTTIRPHYKNIKKRLVKSPKLYINDTGLLCYLLDIQSIDHLKNHPLRGAIFETLVVTEALKSRYHNLQKNNLYFFRDSKGFEIDIIMDHGLKQQAIEIKSSKTFHTDMLKNLTFYQKKNPDTETAKLIYAGNETFMAQNIAVQSIFQAFAQS